MSGSRLRYLERDQVSTAIQALYDRLEDLHGGVPTESKLMAHHASSLAPYLRWQDSLAVGALDPRLRALACVETSQLNNSRYCTAHHVERGRAAGLSREKLAALPEYLTSRLFDELERLVIRYAEEMTRRIQIDRLLVDELERRLGAEALVQLTLTIAAVNFTNRFNVALGTEVEADQLGTTQRMFVVR